MDRLVALARNGYAVGGGRVLELSDRVRLEIGPCDGASYADAQLDDYRPEPSTQLGTEQGRRRDRWTFRHSPPLCLHVRARFSHAPSSMVGTAGFGFWNDPVGMTGRPRMRLPQAVWCFMAGPPSRMPLVLDEPGYGWRAAVLAPRPLSVMAVIGTAPLLAASMTVRPLARRVWPWLRRRLRLAGGELPHDVYATTDWHDYTLDWRADGVTYWVDGVQVARHAVSPPGPLGLVIWIDNQFLVATAGGSLHGGVVACGRQWLEVAALELWTPPRARPASQ